MADKRKEIIVKDDIVRLAKMSLDQENKVIKDDGLFYAAGGILNRLAAGKDVSVSEYEAGLLIQYTSQLGKEQMPCEHVGDIVGHLFEQGLVGQKQNKDKARL